MPSGAGHIRHSVGSLGRPPLPHDPRPILQRDEMRRPLQVGDFERSDRQGQRVDCRKMLLDAAAGPLPVLDRGGTPGGTRGICFTACDSVIAAEQCE